MQRKLVAAAAVVGLLASSCAGPRIVRSMTTTRASKFRLIYDQNKGMGEYEQGIIDCDASADGAISNCHPVKVTFVEGK